VPESPRNAFQYSIGRVLPRVERGECLNVGVVLLCRPRRYLGARIALDERRLPSRRPGPGHDPAHLAAFERSPPAAWLTIARLGLAERFHWLVAPSNDHPAVRGPYRPVRRPGRR
jgi:hypothetical protein